MGINTNLQNIETKLTNLKTNLDGYLVNKGAAAGSTLTQSIDNVDTIQTGGGGGTVKLVNGTKLSQSSWTEVPSNYDFNEIIDMSYMFEKCLKLVTIPQIDTSHTTDMSYMFSYNKELTNIPLLDTSNVTDMQNMFRLCSSITTIPQLDSRNVKDMGFMFYGCSKLTTIQQLDVRSVSNMGKMFNTCPNLSFINLLNLGKIDTLQFADIDFSQTIWGDDTKVAGSKKSLIDSLLTNSFNRTAAGYGSCTIKLSEQTKGYLTEKEKAAITAKGFTIA